MKAAVGGVQVRREVEEEGCRFMRAGSGSGSRRI